MAKARKKTLVKTNFQNTGKPESQYTCPVEASGCKHTVALLEKLKDNQTIPLVSLTDRRWDILTDDQGGAHETMDSLLDKLEPAPAVGKTKGNKSHLSQTPLNEKIKAHLNEKSRQQLVTMGIGWTKRFPELRDKLTEQILLERGAGMQLLKEARKEMRHVTSELGWQNHWNHYGYIPDYSKLKRKLERLVEVGYCDQVVELGRELMERGTEQVEQSDDEGETMVAVSECLAVVFDALYKSLLSTTDKIQYVIEACLQDNYGLIDDAVDPVLELGEPEDWEAVVDVLRKQLQALPDTDSQADFMDHYQRDRLSAWLLRVMKHAGQDDALRTIHEAEARATGSYRLVDHLLEQGDHDAAYDWA